MAEIKINNSKESAVDGKWSKPSSKYYDDLKHSKELLNEAFLVVGEKAGAECSFSASGCKYPHHVIKDDELVLSIPGVKAAYSRARQMGQFKGEVKSHLERHYKELGLYEGSKMESDEAIEENFAFIESSLGIDFMEADAETMLHMYGDNPRDLMRWMYRNIQLEEPDSDWILRSSDQMISEGKGTSHDQALFEMEMFHHMGLNCGRIFCMEYDKLNGTTRWTHTFTWYGEEQSVAVYWFENCWENHFGIHGPFNGIEALMHQVEKEWKEENKETEYNLYFSTEGNPVVGMSLPEYTTSWSIINSIREQMDWIDSFVHDSEFRESVTVSVQSNNIGKGAILLTSTGFDNPKFKKLFLNHIGDPRKCKVLFIPTAANDKESREVLQLCIEEITKCKIPAKNITWYNLDGSISRNELKKFNAIYVAGGSETVLWKAAKKDNFADVVQSVLKNGGIYVGVSAGSMILKNMQIVLNHVEPHQNKSHSPNGPVTSDGRINISDNQAVWITSKEKVIMESYEFEEEYITESARSKKLKPKEIHDYDKEIRNLITSMPEKDRVYIGHGYWVDSSKVCYRRIIKEDGELVGFIDVYHNMPKLDGNPGVVILAVAKGHRGKGYGRRLAKRTVHDFKKGKIEVDYLRWLVDKGNAISKKLVESLGFEKTRVKKDEGTEYKLFRKKDKEETFTEDTTDIMDENIESEGRYAEEDEKLYPIFAVMKSYSDLEVNNDGTPKTDEEIGSIKFAHIMNKFGRGDNYSHALLSFNIELTDMYSFEGDGILLDNIMNRSSWKGTKAIYIKVTFLKKSDYDKLREKFQYLLDHKEETVYAYGNFLRALFAKRVTKQPTRQFCSSFVGYLLNAADPKNTFRDYSRMRPEDMALFPRSFFVGVVKDRDDLIKRLPELRKTVNDLETRYGDEIREYNNDLPKLLLKEQVDKLDTMDKIFDWIINRLLGAGTH